MKNEVANIISNGLTGIYDFCLGIALCLVLLSIVRNYTQFGDQMGIKFIASVLVSIFLILFFPKICDSIHKACLDYGLEASQKIKSAMSALRNSDMTSDCGWFEKLAVNLFVGFYIFVSGLAGAFRDFMYFVMSGMYYGTIAFTPVFMACLCIPEAKQLGISFMTTCFGFALCPLAFLVADYALLAFMNETFNAFIGSAAGGAGMTAASTILSGAVSVWMLKALLSFIVVYTLIAIIVYAVTPFLFMKLFRTGSAGSPMGAIASLMGMALGAAAGPAAAGLSKAGSSIKSGIGRIGGAMKAGSEGTNAATAAMNSASNVASGSGGTASAPAPSPASSPTPPAPPSPAPEAPTANK